jgi:hypothetical protein
VKAHRLVSVVVALGCLGTGALAPTAGCNGTGTTPMCDFPDGANNPEAGCGVLIEASALEGSATDVAEEPVPTPVPDAGHEAASPLVDSSATDSQVTDAGADAPPTDGSPVDADEDAGG